MRIVNHTHYDAKQLRAIVMHVAKQELDPAQRQLIVVHVHYRHQPGNRADRRGRRVETKHLRNYNLGKVGLRYNSMCVELNKNPKRIDRAYLGVQLAHEMAECRGRHHRDMRHPRYGYRDRRQPNVKWGEPWRSQITATAFPISVRPKKSKPAPDQKAAKELQRAQQKIEDWKRKARLAATKLRVWERAVRRINRKLAAAALAEPPPTARVAATTTHVRAFLPFEENE